MSKSIAEEIVEPMEIIWDQLVKLANQSEGSTVSATSPEYTKSRVFAIAQEMDAALTFLRRNIEGLLEPELPPDDFYKYSDDSSREFVSYDDAAVPESTHQEPSILDLFNDYASEENLSSISDMTTHRGEEK